MIGDEQLGTVTAFDDDRGVGTVTGDDGRTWPFHCTAIADGSRFVASGTAVRFVLRVAPPGGHEAAGLVLV